MKWQTLLMTTDSSRQIFEFKKAPTTCQNHIIPIGKPFRLPLRCFRFELIESRAMRIILNCDRLTSRINMLNELNWLSISQRMMFNTLIMIFKMKHNYVPKYLNPMTEILEIEMISRSRSSNMKLLRKVYFIMG